MEIAFNANMYTDFNLSWVNSSNTDIYIEPALNRHEEEGFKLEKINFTWTIQSYKGSTLAIKLNFTSPTSISPLSM